MRIIGLYGLLFLILLIHTAHLSLDLFDRVVKLVAKHEEKRLVQKVKDHVHFPDRRRRIEAHHPVRGVDISHWDGDIDWAALKKSGISFVYIKATQGLEDVDPMFEQNWKNARKHGIRRGAYHFFDPDSDGEAQARHFLKTVKLRKDDMITAVDVEVAASRGSEQLVSELQKWLKTVEQQVKHKPMIYCDVPFWNEHVKADMGEYPLWLAQWEDEEKPNELPMGWQDYAMWQYSATGTVHGINHSSVDLNIWKQAPVFKKR
jgi:lysozyme